MVVKCQICVVARKQNYLLSGDARALSLCLHTDCEVKVHVDYYSITPAERSTCCAEEKLQSYNYVDDFT